MKKIANFIKKDNRVLKLTSMNREEAIKVFDRFKEDKDKILY